MARQYTVYTKEFKLEVLKLASQPSIKIVFRGELFLDTFSAHQKKYQAPRKKSLIFEEGLMV